MDRARMAAYCALLLILVAILPCSAEKVSLLVNRGHASGVMAVAFSPDGKTLASAGVDSAIKIWDVATGRELTTLVGHDGWVYSLSFSPDGKVLASGGSDKMIKIWDLAKGCELRTLNGHGNFVYSVAFSPDGKILASGSQDKYIKLWDVATGKELQTLKGHTEYVSAVAFSPDGKTLASGSGDHSIRIWNVSPPHSGRQDQANAVPLETLPSEESSFYSLDLSAFANHSLDWLTDPPYDYTRLGKVPFHILRGDHAVFLADENSHTTIPVHARGVKKSMSLLRGMGCSISIKIRALARSI